MQGVSLEAVLVSVACGLVVDTLLILNNYRDHDNDLRAGKKTLVVHIGKKNAERLYCALGNLGIITIIGVTIYEVFQHEASSMFLPLAALYIVLHNRTYMEMKKIGEGRELNRILGKNSSKHLLFRHCIIPDHHRNGELNNNKLIIMYARTLLYK